MGRPLARKGDTISHGGFITDGSPDTETNGRPNARRGDPVVCVIHGSQAIAAGSPDTETNGRPQARYGDPITCGAFISSGSEDTEVN